MAIKLTELGNGSRVLAQFSRRDNEEGTAPDWSEPREVSLYVRRDFLTKRILELGIWELDWASYSESDYFADHDEWLVEEYRMRILKIVDQY